LLLQSTPLSLDLGLLLPALRQLVPRLRLSPRGRLDPRERFEAGHLQLIRQATGLERVARSVGERSRCER
jgi:hypothetical protein